MSDSPVSDQWNAWPPITLETRPWTPDPETPRRWRSTFSGPYQAAVVPEIAGLNPGNLPTGLAATVTGATADIARFDGEMGNEIAPFGAILLRSESAASSQIEHLTASAKAIAIAELGSNGARNAAEIVGNTRAMTAAIDLADNLDGPAILEMHRVLMERTHPSIAGQWRTQQVWVGTSSYGPHTAAFVPPHHERVEAAIDDLVGFMRRDDLPALVHSALAHAQFETIHPFVDGNGRAGRALVHSLLRSKGLTTRITVPISAGLLTDTDRYFEALTDYRSGKIEPIVECFAEASFIAVRNGRQLVTDLREIRAGWHERLDRRSQASVWKVLPIIMRQPVISSQYLQTELDVSAPAADSAIADLVELDIVRQIGNGKRNRVYETPEALEALDAFATRSGRRTPSGA
jgi:Fic family protein